MKTTPGYVHLAHDVFRDHFSGDEVLEVTKHLEIINNYVYIDGNNTGINVKGEKGDKGDKGDPGEAVQSNWAETDSTKSPFIQNKPLNVIKTIDPETGDENYEVEFV